MGSLDEWLKLAPKPRPRNAGDQWDVFLSYRSVSRPWVIALYDALRQRDYQVFLDQYSLSAADRLEASLERHLQQSGSGVLIWSSRSEDSEWCQKERIAFSQLESAKPGFQYVVVKLDDADLPLLAKQKLWIDFSGSREGPNGSNLLRLMYGLQANPLPLEAVTLATEVDQQTTVALARIAAAKEAGDPDALVHLAASQSLAWQSSAQLGSNVAEALIGMKKNDEALAVLDKLLKAFPKSIRPKQLEALAHARKSDWRRAQMLLGELYFLGARDPETVGIYAHTWRARFVESRDPLHLRKARDLYGEAFKSAPSDYYTGINAATNSVLLGDLASAKTYAEAVAKIVGNQPKPGDYWMTATFADLQLINGDYDRAAEIYSAAVAMAPEAKGDHEATLRQTRRLMDKLQPDDVQRGKVEAAFFSV